MTEYMDPFDYIEPENIDEKLEIALEDPPSNNYRSRDPAVVNFEPEDRLIDQATVDLGNRNVGVQYEDQETEERYVVIMKRIGLALVESHANISQGSETVTTVNYHVVTPELGLMYDGEGYVETANNLPRQTAKKAPELLEKAKEVEEVDFNSTLLEPPAEETNETTSVPPPRKDPLFDD